MRAQIAATATSADSNQGSAPAGVHLLDEANLQDLDRLVCETYQLWDHEWVGFSWRNYTYDHVRRVRNLALSLVSEEGGDARVLDVAAVLHDVTKSYDGEALVRDGERVLDAQGFWRNEFLPPARSNRVTALYDALGLAGALHNVSGARIADALLAEYGYTPAFRAHVAEIIVSHLKVTPDSSPEGRCLYDADTIDANIGHPALYRNIQISMHRLVGQLSERGDSVDTYLADHLSDLLHDYVCEKWPAWVSGKNRDFVARMTTEAGRRRALARISRLEATLALMRAELDDLDAAMTGGYLAPVVHFMRSRRNPSLAEEAATLAARWPAGSPCGAARFLEHLRQESAGVV